MTDDEVYLRRVRDPNPMLRELARQAVDALESRREDRAFQSVTSVAREFGVPFEYVLDEMERRVRERQKIAAWKVAANS